MSSRNAYKPKFVSTIEVPEDAIYINIAKDKYDELKEEFGSHLHYDSKCFKCWIYQDCDVKKLILEQCQVVEKDQDLRQLVPEEDRIYIYVPYGKVEITKSIGGSIYATNKGKGIWFLTKGDSRNEEQLTHFRVVEY